jgi:hypothetical protein
LPAVCDYNLLLIDFVLILKPVYINYIVMKKDIFLPVLVILLLFSACRKNELTLPAKVFFEFELIDYLDDNNLKSEQSIPVPLGKMTVDKGLLKINSIEFYGQRDEGRSVYFISDLRQPLVVDLESGISNQVVSFDIPQGIYNLIEIQFELLSDGGIPLVLEGSIAREPSEELPLRFEYENLHEKIQTRAESGQNSNKVVLRRDTNSTARIIIDSRSVFQFVNRSMLQEASLSSIGGEEVLLINSFSNKNIFNIMAERLERSFKVIID